MKKDVLLSKRIIMNCAQFQNMLDDYIDGTLTAIQFNRTQTHINECDHCQDVYAQANELLAVLKELPVPPATAGYEKRVLSFLENKQMKAKQDKSWIYAGFTGAVAASFALWLVFSPLSLFSNGSEKISTINLLVQKKQTIDLVFNLASELSSATLTIELPEKIEIAGYAGKRQLSWKTSFKKGANRLALPIIGSEERSGILIARLTNKGTSKTFRVRINTKQSPTSFFKIKELTVTNS